MATDLDMGLDGVNDRATQGYEEAEAMLRDLLTPDLISGTAIRVARDHMMQFLRKSRLSDTAAEALSHAEHYRRTPADFGPETATHIYEMIADLALKAPSRA